MIIGNNSNVIRNNGAVLSNVPELSIINSARYFPRSSYNNNIGFVEFIFSEPTSVTVLWGDGTSTTYSTVLRDGVNIFDIKRRATATGGGSIPNPSTDPFVSSGKDYGSEALRMIKFSFDNSLLISFRLNQVFIPNQQLYFNFFSYPNLTSFNLNVVTNKVSPNLFADGAISNLDLFNLEFSNIYDIGILSSFDSNSPIDTTIPLNLFNMPLKNIGISGNHQLKTFNESNFNLIGELLADTLESLHIKVRFLDNSGINQTPADLLYPNTGGLPGNFLKLTKLKKLSFAVMVGALSWTTIPSIISQMTWLEELSFDFSKNGTSTFSISSNFFQNLTSLKRLDLTYLNNNISNWDFIDSLSVSLEEIILRGNDNLTRLDASIMACFNWIKTNGYEDKIFMFEDRPQGGAAAVVPSGTYQEPIDHDNPASPLEAIWVMRNIYNCTVTYRES